MDIYLKEFEKLNEYQKQAVASKEKNVLLNAAVGSGKTTVLVHKVLYLYLVEKVPLEQMFILTFTRRAAEEIKTRILDFVQQDVEDRIKPIKESLKYLGTFHSVATQILRESTQLQQLGYEKGFEIIDNVQASEMLYRIIDERKLEIKYKKKLIKRLEEFRNGKHLYGVMKKTDDIEELVNQYNKEKLLQNVMDFDDIIENCSRTLDQPINPRWVIIDEFQDTDEAQLELVKKICGEDTRIFCIGDPNQVIYSWRSGTNNIFGQFKAAFRPTELSLPLNYRSSRTIIEAANALLMGRHSVEGVKEYGNLIKIVRHNDEFNEACHVARTIKAYHNDKLPYKNCAVLYRRQAQLDMLIDVFEKEQIPYHIVNKKNLAFLEDEQHSSVEVGVNLLTLHASKGLEFSNVFIIGANMGNIPLTSNKVDEPEEMRLFYVGITRAKDNVEISYVARPSTPGVVPYRSPYISMIPSQLLEIQDDENKTKSSLTELMAILREQRNNRKPENKRATHPKYGTGEIVFEDDETIRVKFEEYGEKEFSKMFSSVEIH